MLKKKKSKARPRKPAPPSRRSPTRATTAVPVDPELLPLVPPKVPGQIDELNYWETTYGRGVQRRKPGVKVPGEARARIAEIKTSLDRLGVPIRWDGERYVIDLTELKRADIIRKSGPPIMSDEERAASCCQIQLFEIEPGTDTYAVSDDDGDGILESHKKIKFRFKVQPGADPMKCVLVNWMKGFFKDG